MAKVYKNQSSLRLVLDTGINLTTATTLEIKYIKPDYTTGTLIGTLTGTTSMYYDYTNTLGVSELNVSGLWRFWTRVVFSDNRIGIGEPVELMVYTEGE
jgi:hypothetical protein